MDDNGEHVAQSGAGRLTYFDLQGEPLRRSFRDYAHDQAGFTLIEVVIAAAIGAILMSALTSVILTSVRASATASSRIEASGQIRNFEFFAYDDFAQSAVPTPSGCGTVASPCTTQAIALNGVSYAWDGSAFLDRQVGSNVTHMATNVTGFSWYVDSSLGHPTVVINLTVTIQAFSDQPYSESQPLLFYPRVNP
jgi:prepilin-type N-terminal cleavage/methylation domain-containing protein